MKLILLSLLTLALSPMSIGCGDGDGDGADASSTQGSSFANNVWPTIEANCKACHETGEYHPGFLLTDAPTAYASLTMDEPDDTSVHSRYVVPGDSAGSLLIDKMINAQPVYGGDQMPPGGLALAASQVAVVVSWIDEGAQNN